MRLRAAAVALLGSSPPLFGMPCSQFRQAPSRPTRPATLRSTPCNASLHQRRSGVQVNVHLESDFGFWFAFMCTLGLLMPNSCVVMHPLLCNQYPQMRVTQNRPCLDLFLAATTRGHRWRPLA